MQGNKCIQGMVIAIDFGSSHTGFAYAFNTERKMLFSKERWEGSPINYPKTLTAILYSPAALKKMGSLSDEDVDYLNKPESPVYWGFVARELHILKKNDNFVLFSGRLKMSLYEPEKVEGNNEPLVQGSDKKWYPAKNVIADILRCMKVSAINEVKKTISMIPPGGIKWVITVPAIWKPAQRQMMKEAAEAAGLIAGKADEITIVLEPEAAAVYARERGAVNFREGNKTFMIVDAGGGTVDITVQSAEDRSFKVISAPKGGPYGSTYVDDIFFNYLKQQLINPIDKLDTFSLYFEKNERELLEAKKTWENVKCDPITQSVYSSDVEYKLPFGFFVNLQKNHNQVLDNLHKKNHGNADKILIDKSDIKHNIFMPIFKAIDSQIEKVLSDINIRCDFIILAGGFGRSLFLLEEIKEKFSGKSEILVLPDSGVAVLYGAVLLGLNPTTITERYTQKTYGIQRTMPFDHDKDPESKKLLYKVSPKSYVCNDRFDVFVKKGESIPVDKVVEKRFLPIDLKRDNKGIIILASDDTEVRYADEKGVTILGRITVDLKNVEEAVLSMCFGDTEIKVTAMDVRTGKIHSAKIAYEVDYQYIEI